MTHKPRLIWLDVTEGKGSLQPLWKCLYRHVEQLTEPDFQVALTHCSRSACGIRHPATRVVQDAVTLAEAHRQKNNADAMVVGCWGAPRVALKAALNIPVIGVGEAAILQARPLVEFATIVTVAQSLESDFATDVRVLTGGRGFTTNPVRALRDPLKPQDLIKAVEDPSELIGRFECVADEAVRDGADAILTGCGYIGPIFASHGYDRLSSYPNVPVLDCTLLTVAAIKTLYEFRRYGLEPACSSFPPIDSSSHESFCSAISRLN